MGLAPVATNITTTWQLQDIPFYASVQGTARQQRNGTKIYVDKLEFNVRITPVTANVQPNGTTCRFMVYHTIDSQGTQTAIGDILSSWNDQSGAAVAPTFNSVKQLDYFPKKATIIFDKMHSMYSLSGYGTAAASTGPVWEAQFTLPIKRQINFVSNLGTIADIRGHTYGIAYCADDSNCCTINCDVRWRFKDM